MKIPTSLRASLLASSTAASMLAAQVLVHRLISLKLVGNYAFFVISLTMMGFGVSGVILTRLMNGFRKAPGDWLAACAAGFAATLIAAPTILLRADTAVGVTTRPDFVVAFLKSIPAAMLFAIPFTFGGTILGFLLSSREYPTRRVYFYDLMGSAAGAFLILPILTVIGVERALIAVCLFQLAATLVLMPPSTNWGRGAVVATALFSIAAGVKKEKFFELKDSTIYPFSPTRGVERRATLLHAAWDPLGRAELWQLDGAPKDFFLQSLFGDDDDYRKRFQRVLTQNNWAYTYAPQYDGTLASIAGIERTMYAASYLASSVQHPRVAVIGVGGGSDILAALRFGAADVTGIEANGATFNIYKNIDRAYFGKWADDPRVHLVHDEGRHFIANTSGTFDIIQLSGVDTYSGTPGAAHVFTENYLYTLDAFELYLSRLSDQGMFGITRVEWPPSRELMRIVTTAVATLRRAGVQHPARHIVVIASEEELLMTALVKRTPFTTAELDGIERAVIKNPLLRVYAGPRWNAQKKNNHQVYLAIDDPKAEEDFLVRAPFDIRPVDDDRPFYFRFSFWWHLFPGDPAIWGQIPVMEYSVIMLFGVVGVVALACIYLPLRLLRKRSGGEVGSFRMGAYFAALGVGFMAVEMALLQSFGLFLGHPNYALSVVLAGLLFAAGIGSLVAERMVAKLGGVRFVAYALAAIILFEFMVALPRLPGLMLMPFVVRCAVTLALIFPVGVCLGVFLPSGIESVKTHSGGALVPWAWGVNGVFSVLGPLAAIAFSLTYGVGSLLLISIPIYLAAGWLFVKPAPSEDGPAT